MPKSLLKRVLAPIVELRDEEVSSALMMFTYSFLVMAAYNTIKPSATSKFINSLGAENIPYVNLVAGLLMGIIMQLYSRLLSAVPRRWVFPGTQVVVIASLVLFWSLFKTGQSWVSVAFYVWGRVLLGIFLISQFWTLANAIYDPRQAKRVFGFIGGGSFLGGIAGSWLTALLAKRIGTGNLLLVSSVFLVVCFVLIIQILQRTTLSEPAEADSEENIGGGEALRMLRQSKHLQLISMVIGFAALGAVVIDQQLNMAAEEQVQGGSDAITAFLGSVTGYASTIGIVVQMWLTPHIHRLLGIGFALQVMPVSLGASAILILFNPVLWTSGVARVLDQTLRYSLDKTTREVLFLPLPAGLKLKAKPFVDVAVDRFIGKGLGSILLLVVLKLFHFTWSQLSILSIALCLLWMFMARRAKQEYLAVFRRSFEKQELGHTALTAPAADLATIEALVEELGSFDERRVLYAIDVLESLDKRHLVSPLLLHHDSPAVRARALRAFAGATRTDATERRLPAVERLLRDESPEVRAAAVSALAALRGSSARDLMLPYLEEKDPRIAATAAVALASSGDDADLALAESTLERLASDPRQSAAAGRREAVRAIHQIGDPRLRHLLIPLLYDPDVDVAKDAVARTKNLGEEGYFFIPALVSLLRHRQLKTAARSVLVSYGEGVVDILGYFMRDPEEDPWVRRHVPATLAQIPSQKSVDLLVATLSDDDGFLRFKCVAALEKLHRGSPELKIPKEPIEKLTQQEALRYFRYFGLHYNLFRKDGLPKDSLLAQALVEKQTRVLDRVYRLLGLLYSWQDVLAARRAIERGEPRLRASAVEFLDNVLAGALRKRILPILEDMPLAERVKRGNVLLKTRTRDAEETLARLIYDEDPVVAATAIDTVRETRAWTLAPDLEQVLAYRDAKDWVVFEAASWALAAHRLPEEKRRVV